MTEPATADGVGNPQTDLRRLVDSLAERFPDVDRAEIDKRVSSIYAGLKEQATVDSHLMAVTEGHATDEFRRRGATVHVRDEDVD